MHAVRALPRGRDRRRRALRRLVRARASHRRAARAVLRRRFASMRWSILTPERLAALGRRTLSFGPGRRPARGAARRRCRGRLAHLLRSIFNPARAEVGAMRARDAEEILAQPAGGAADSAADRRSATPAD